MSVKQIIQESIEKNPLGLKEALQEELSNRVRLALALEARMSELDEDTGFSSAIDKAESSRQAALKRAAKMVKKGFSHESAAKSHDVSLKDLKTHLGEEVEELDEISKNTLGSYVKKAIHDVSDVASDIGRLGTKSPEYDSLRRIRKNRKAGIRKAADRLMKD
jgi:hypothetical protein